MSLKVIHVIFVVCAALGLAFLAVWCFSYFANRNPLIAVSGGLGAGFGLFVLLLLERRVLSVLRKVR